MIKVNGVSTLKRFALGLAPKARASLQQLTVETAVAMRDEAQSRAPVDTGELRDSIRFELNNGGLSFILLADAEHWVFVEFGTYKMSPQPFLLPSYLLHKDLYLSEIRRRLPRILR